MPYHADTVHVPTPGNRGKTTRRRSTHSVRGPEGRFIAQVKEELKRRPKGWLVFAERRYWPHRTRAWESRTSRECRFDTQQKAEAYAATLPVGPTYIQQYPMHWVYTAQVWVEREP
jgi:hypothetical protein